jgi:hypothetical protein
MTKKCKRGDIEAERATTAVAAAKRAERGDRGSGVHIGGVQFHLDGCEFGNVAIEQLVIEEPAPQTE